MCTNCLSRREEWYSAGCSWRRAVGDVAQNLPERHLDDASKDTVKLGAGYSRPSQFWWRWLISSPKS